MAAPEAPAGSPTTERVDRARLAFAALFVTALVTGQLLAVKVLAFDLPVALPAVGDAILVPAGVLAYALTFFATDCYAELYGRAAAESVVRMGFAMLLVMLALVWLAIVAPGSPAGVPPGEFATVMSATTSIVTGGLAAYLVSQHWDVFAFHAIRERTGVERLWLRNLGSTATSQLLDTVIFISLAFGVVPRLVGVGTALPLAGIGSLIVGQYLLKLLIALADTPLVYAAVGWARRSGRAAPAEPAD